MEKLAEAKKQNDTEQIEMLSEKIKKHDDDIHEIKQATDEVVIITKSIHMRGVL